MSAPVMKRSGRPTRDEAAALDKMIVEVALRSFLDHGYEGTTIERVVELTGTTRRSVLHRYADRDALLVASAELYLQMAVFNVLAKAEAEAENAEPMEALRRACRLLFEHSLQPDSIAFARLISHQAFRVPALSALVVETSDQIELTYARLIANAQANGIFERHGARSLARVAVGVFTSNPLNRATYGDPAFSEEYRGIYFSDAWSVFLAAA